jgi:hypothetical protein
METKKTYADSNTTLRNHQYHNNNLVETDLLKESEFSKLINTFMIENKVLNENVEALGFKLNVLKVINPEKISENCLVAKEPSSIIDALWNQIYELRANNARLNSLYKHLDNIV